VTIELGDGLIQSVVLHDEVPASLADALKEIKAIDASTLKQAQTRVAEVPGLTLARALLEMRSISPDVLNTARHGQIKAEFLRVMERMNSLRHFRLTPQQAAPIKGIEPVNMMAALVLDHGHAKRTRSLVLELGAVEARDGISIDRLTERFSLTRKDRVLLELLMVPRRCKDLLEVEDFEHQRTARLIRAMRLLGIVMATPEGRAKGVVPVEVRRHLKQMEEAAPKRRVTLQDMPVPPGDRKLLKDVEALAEQDFFTLFDLDTETTKKEVNQAFLNLAQTWHPDRVQARHPRLMAAVTKLFARINNARDTLEDKVLRETYAAHLKQNSGRTFRKQELSPTASRLECQKAKVLMRKKDFWGAALHLKRAGKLDPKNKQVGALELLCHIRDPKTDPKQRIVYLEEAGKSYPNEEELVFERAMEHFNRRNFRAADELLRETLQLRPHHRGAERYLKLTKMRLSQNDEARQQQKKKGIFNRS
jgi:curved DNA-binding protein CbpA